MGKAIILSVCCCRHRHDNYQISSSQASVCAISITNQLDIGEKLCSTHFKLLKMAYYSTINCAFSVQHAYGLLTTPTPLVCANATAHTRVQCKKWSSSHKSSNLSVVQSVAMLHYSGYRAHGVYCALESSSYYYYCVMTTPKVLNYKVLGAQSPVDKHNNIRNYLYIDLPILSGAME